VVQGAGRGGDRGLVAAWIGAPLVADKFVHDPAAAQVGGHGESGAWLVKVGDRGRWAPAGLLVKWGGNPVGLVACRLVLGAAEGGARRARLACSQGAAGGARSLQTTSDPADDVNQKLIIQTF